MNCNKIEEQIPWWLNGSLEPEEALRVEQHLQDCQACRRQVSEVQWAGRMFAAHPEVRFLVDFGFGRVMEADERQRLEVHLGFCAECQQDLASIRASRETMADDAIASTDLAAKSNLTPFAEPRRSAEPRRAPPSFQRWLAAAALVAAVLGVGGWWTAYRQLGQQRTEFEGKLALVESQAVEEAAARLAASATASQRPEPPAPDSVVSEEASETVGADRTRMADRMAAKEVELDAARQRIEALQASARRPRLNTPVIDLYSEATVRRSASFPGGEAKTPGANYVEIPADADLVTLILVPDPGAQSGWSGVRLRDQQGREIWSLDGLLASAAGDYTVTLPTSALPGPTALLELFGEGGRLERYPLEIQRR